MKTNFNSSTTKAAFAHAYRMRVASRLILAWVFISCIGYAPILYAQSTEEDAIKEAIRAETMSYFNRNADAWQATWLQDDKATRTLVFSNMYSAVTGWDKLSSQMLKELKDNPKPFPVEIATGNVIIRTENNMAWVEFDQVLTAPTIDPGIKELSKEFRGLIKKEGNWKIFSQISQDPQMFAATPEAIERNLNNNGYLLTGAKKVKEAIEVFKLNAQLYPNSANAYDSLGEAYAMDGNKKMAIKSYEKSIELNPKNETGKAALAKLK